MKVLVFGSRGMVGHVVADVLSKDYDVVRHSRCAEDGIDLPLDISMDNIYELRQLSGYDVIVNAVGCLGRFSEKNPDIAMMINALLPKVLYEATEKTGAKLVHLSTNGVFSGREGRYMVDEPPDPCDFYGMSKWLGEIPTLTIRMSVIGPKGGLFEWLMNQSGEVQGYSNIEWNGVTSLELANVIRFCIENDVSGVHQVSAAESISKARLLRMIADVFGRQIEVLEREGESASRLLESTINKYRPKRHQEMLEELKEYLACQF